MVITSLWEFKCYYTPDTAEQEYEAALSPGELGRLMANKAMQEVLADHIGENCND